jgi:pimeloyl-ACP methyl ester carboxylesterase
VTCSQIFRGGGVATKTRLIPGQDNSPYIEQALDRWQTMNKIIADKVDFLNRHGVTIQMVDTIPERAPEEWDQVLASDCIHLNEVGQSQIADAYLPALGEILKRPASQDVPSPEATPPQWTPEADQAWEDYLKTVELDKLQDQCRPRIIREKASATGYKGMAVLYHGFTACPQQFFELAEDLSALGYTVVLPLLPGHGRQWSEVDGKKIDDLSLLPQGILSLPHSYQESYGYLAAQMNHLASKVQGDRVIAGLSVGGSLVSITTMLRSDLWDRQLILSPLYEIGPDVMRALLGTISNTQRQLSQLIRIWDPILDKNLGWGQGCESERDPGFLLPYGRQDLRGGICQFKVTHVGAANQIGYDAWETIRPTQITTQVVAVAQDPVINKQLVFNGVGQMRSESLKFLPFRTERRFDQHPAVRVCYLPSDNEVCKENLEKPIDLQEKPCINHSLLSRFDSPQQNKYWITPLNRKITRFLTAGEFLEADPLERVHGDPLCSGF